MRRIIIASTTLFALVLAACSSNKPATTSTITTDNTQKQRNLAADRVLIGVFETGDVDKLDAIIDPSFINHAGTGDRVGLDSLKTGVKAFHTLMKSVKVDRKRQLADEEYVSDWIRFIGDDPKAVIEGMEVTRYANGKAVEHWFFPNSQTRRN